MVGGRVEMQDGFDRIDVNPASGHVSGDQCLGVTGCELFQGPGALALGSAPVDRDGVDAVPAKLAGQSIGTVPRAGEDN